MTENQTDMIRDPADVAAEKIMNRAHAAQLYYKNFGHYGEGLGHDVVTAIIRAELADRDAAVAELVKDIKGELEQANPDNLTDLCAMRDYCMVIADQALSLLTPALLANGELSERSNT